MTFDPTLAIWVAEITLYDPVSAAETTVTFATRNAYTVSGATPESAGVLVRLEQPTLAARTAFAARATSGRSQFTVGQVLLNNAFGALDVYRNYGWDGRAIVIKYGQSGDEYATDFVTALDATMQGATFGQEQVRIQLRDWQRATSVPLQTSLYAGTGTLEGDDNLLGKPKPVCYGAPRNIEPVLVNATKLIYQIHDGAIASLGNVYDEGVSLTASTVAWTLRTSGFSSTAINGLAYGNSIHVAVGNTGKIFRSTDSGVTWTAAGTPSFSTTNIMGVTYGGGLFVAVGASGKLATSTDGDTWTQRTSGFGTTQINGVGYGNGLYVAVGASGTMTTSPDATTWTSRSPGFGTNSINAVAYGGGRWVACGAGAGSVNMSTSGTTWGTAQQITPGATAFKGVAYQNRFVIVGESGIIYTSILGDVWTVRSTSATGVFGSANLSAIAFGRNQFVTVTTSGLLGTSPDGEIWTRQDSLFSSTAINAVAFGGGRFVTAGDSGTLATSGAVTIYTSQADLLDDTLAPAWGTYGVYPAGGYIRLGSPAIGRVTCDPVATYDGNQLLRSQEFDNASWSKSNVTVTANATTAPDGTSTADKIEVTSTGPGTSMFQAVTAISTDVTYSIYAKKGSGATHGQRFGLFNATSATNLLFVDIDYDSGALSYAIGSSGARAIAVGSGWWRITMTVSGVTVGHSIQSYAGWASGAQTAGRYAYVWGAQHDPRGFATSYQATTSAAVSHGASAALIAADVLDRAGFAVADSSGDDLCDLDDANDATLGYYTTQGDQVMCADVLDLVTQSVGAWWGTDKTGIIRVAILDDPAPNLVLNPSSLGSSPWVTALQTASNIVYSANSRSYSRITNGTPGSTSQTVTLTDGVKVLCYAVKHNGTTGQDAQLLNDSTAGTPLALVIATFNADGSVSFTLSAGASLHVRPIATGEYDVRVVTLSATASHTNIVYASDASGIGFGAGTVPSFLIGSFRLYDEEPAAYLSQDTDLDGMAQAPSSDANGGLPPYRTVIRYSRNYAPMSNTDVAGNVDDTTRALFGKEWLDIGTVVDTDVLAEHPLSAPATVETLLTNSDDANAEASRRQSVFGVDRFWFDVPCYQSDDTLAVELGDAIEVSSTRYGMGAGSRMLVLGITPDAASGRVTFSGWL